MVLGPIVRCVGGAWSPEVAELSLCVPAAQPVEAGIHGFGGLGRDLVGEDAVRRGVVGLHRGSRLRVAQFDEGRLHGDS